MLATISMNICLWMPSCVSHTYMMESDNDLEIYVNSTHKNIKSYSDKYANCYFNTLILFPKYHFYTYQADRTRPVSTDDCPSISSGTYINRGDTIICLPDITYHEEILNGPNIKSIVSDTTDLLDCVIKPIWFKRQTKDLIIRIDPYGFVLDFASRIDSITGITGYRWTKKDFEFKELSSKQKPLLFNNHPGYAEPDSVYQSYLENKHLKFSEDNLPFLSPIYHRVPLKVKITNIKLSRKNPYKFYEVVKQ